MLKDILIGALLGTLSGLGTGGGSLLILWLTLVKGVDPATSKAINLLFFIPAALIACLMRRKNIPIKKTLPAIVAGSVCAGLFAYWSAGWNTDLLKKLFGLLLLVTGLRELLYKPKDH